MTYRDQLLTCASCGRQFVFRVEEQRAMAEQGLEVVAPSLCPECRHQELLGPGLHGGVIKWFNPEKHFGFIAQSDGSDIFFHRTAVAPEDLPRIAENAAVWYEIEMSERGPQAINVHLRE